MLIRNINKKLYQTIPNKFPKTALYKKVFKKFDNTKKSEILKDFVARTSPHHLKSYNFR